ncbi:MAG: hypothetical protein ABR569_07910 [Gaiellaceae bacterium]
MRRVLAIGLLLLGLAGCGGSSAGPAGLDAARARTTAAGSARFRIVIDAEVGGVGVRSDENGTVSFARPRAHIYKLVQGLRLPEELVVIGPVTYANANVEAAMTDSSVKPWTRLDRRGLTPKQRTSRPDELAHIRAGVYLTDGVSRLKRIAMTTLGEVETTHFRGMVNPARLSARVPAAVAIAIRNDYPGGPFRADFWVDRQGRVRRVLVEYRTPRGGRISVDAAYSGFGTRVDLTVPPPRDVQDVTPAS